MVLGSRPLIVEEAGVGIRVCSQWMVALLAAVRGHHC
jgi:hypothetical protein